MTKPVLRCALYTRKSSEDGLEQAFNSLDAQREAAEAYVISQRSEGWRALDLRYDDGGHSGGSMDRPALRRLMADVVAGRIDIVLVYKIDRLTRSLADFARIVEVFDRHGVSFVSVTQAFNTTSSMGRLTLNVLLSFAQFEREVTGERIRDKIAASKARGMWMGGKLPLGYDLPAEGSHRLEVNEAEASTVRHIFQSYLALGSVHALCQQLTAEGIGPKQHVTRGGRAIGGTVFSRGALFHLLRNRLYLGEIRHRDLSHPGLHAPIVTSEIVEAVQARLDAQIRRHALGTEEHPRAPLTGRIFDAEGFPMSPTTARGRSGRSYRYYVSAPLQQGRGGDLVAPNPPRKSRSAARPGGTTSLDIPQTPVLRRVAANALEARVAQIILRLLALVAGDPLIVPLRVEVLPTALNILLPVTALASLRPRLAPDETVARDAVEPARLRLACPLGLEQRGGRTEVLASAEGGLRQDPALVGALRKAHALVHRDLRELPRVEAGPASPYQRRLIRLAFLSPDLQQAILEGRQPPDLTLARLMDSEIALCWEAQARQFGAARLL
jgi:site-specific DNA recombinase